MSARPSLPTHPRLAAAPWHQPTMSCAPTPPAACARQSAMLPRESGSPCLILALGRATFACDVSSWLPRLSGSLCASPWAGGSAAASRCPAAAEGLKASLGRCTPFSMVLQRARTMNECCVPLLAPILHSYRSLAYTRSASVIAWKSSGSVQHLHKLRKHKQGPPAVDRPAELAAGREGAGASGGRAGGLHHGRHSRHSRAYIQKASQFKRGACYKMTGGMMGGAGG